MTHTAAGPVDRTSTEPVPRVQAPQPSGDDVPPWHPSQPHHELAADVRWWVGMPVAFGLFGRLALDQIAYREVAVAVDATGRFRENFTNRGIRSYLWGPLMLFGDETDRRSSAQRLKDLHGQVKGRGKGHFEGERYSALKPAIWKWVGTTSMLIFYKGYVATYGSNLDDEQREVVYRTILAMSDYDLNSEQARVPRTVAEMEAYYEEVATTDLADNEFLQWANREFGSLPVPTLVGPRWLHLLITPAWRLATPVLSRPARVCAEETAHPRMRELLGVRESRVRALEFRAYTAMLRAVRRWLPAWALLEPMAHNRYRYERLRAAYARPQLRSFAAPGSAPAAPRHSG
ncbi:oxygenase MpaB family protein [Nocardioides sp. AE5]|uniref:oxygenase MpaB family protein n=1 Tax=Nocardioides sp. AE5 TaxID=2962573 RepID=UPI002882403B|nr:oxygenase MpaB family protein [Nocardioides sp. AE5]MDT0202306.1 oxygenase MpaB family protein [Nocardioides sp. AE5]